MSELRINHISSERTVACTGNLPLLELIREIAVQTNHDALREFHEKRRPFQNHFGRRLRFVDYARVLQEKALGSSTFSALGDETIECAFDLLMDRFYNLPGMDTGQSRDNPKARGNGADCRLYFQAYLNHMDEIRKSHPKTDPLREEFEAGHRLQRHVDNQWKRCLLEGLRSNPQISRYSWKVGGGRISVRFPIDFPGHKRRAWLEKKVKDPNPFRPGEKERVQSIIDEKIPKGQVWNLDECPLISGLATEAEAHVSWSIQYGLTTEGLAKTVAKEKAATISRQRPSIRALGPENLQSLVLRIFDAVDCFRYIATDMARRFGLSKAALSRFAAMRWSESKVPDLWRNTAQVLSRHEGFVEAAKAAGIWEKAREILKKDKKSR